MVHVFTFIEFVTILSLMFRFYLATGLVSSFSRLSIESGSGRYAVSRRPRQTINVFSVLFYLSQTQKGMIVSFL